jgi:hypothetical protein
VTAGPGRRAPLATKPCPQARPHFRTALRGQGGRPPLPQLPPGSHCSLLEATAPSWKLGLKIPTFYSSIDLVWWALTVSVGSWYESGPMVTVTVPSPPHGVLWALARCIHLIPAGFLNSSTGESNSRSRLRCYCSGAPRVPTVHAV